MSAVRYSANKNISFEHFEGSNYQIVNFVFLIVIILHSKLN